jgi:hypothetical protein
MKLGIQEMANEDGSENSARATDLGAMKIENDRLKTTLMILNQKMKVNEDNEDLADKWKS